MLNIRKLNIIQLYRKLPYIVFKDTYLLPQFPALPKKSLDLQTLTSLNKLDNPNEFLSKLSTKEIPSISKKELLNYKLETQNYLKNYLALIRQPDEDLICLRIFAEENAAYITEKMNGKVKITKTDLQRIFKAFPITARSDYQRRAEEDYQIEMQIFNQFQQLHKIPPLVIDTPQQFYQKTMQIQQIVNYPKYSQLKKQQKQIYQNAYRIASQLITNKYQAFLKPFNLSKEQLDIIVQICNKKKQYSEIILDITSQRMNKKNALEYQLASEKLGQQIYEANKLFKLTQYLPQEVISNYQTFFKKASNKQFQLPPLVDWEYQKSSRKCFDTPKISINMQKKTVQTLVKQQTKQPIIQASMTHNPLKQVSSQTVKQDTLLKSVHPKNKSSKAELKSENDSALKSLDYESNNQQATVLQQGLSIQTNIKVTKEKQQWSYETQDDQLVKNTIRSTADEMYDLDKFDDLQGISQINQDYAKVIRKLQKKPIK